MPSRDQALAELAGRADRSAYEEAARRLGVPPGLVYLTATGIPADGGDEYTDAELARPGVVGESTQLLVYGSSEAVDPTTRRHVHEWIRARVAADTQMQAAAALRDAAPGEVLAPEEHDVATVLTRDHDQVLALFEQLKTIPGVSSGGSEVHLSRRESIADMIVVALSGHEAVEQEHFWPAVRSALPDGEERASAALEQERQGTDLLTRLGELTAGDEEFDQVAEELAKAARRHVAFEDQVLLALHEVMSPEDREALGRRLQRAERQAPTRPHSQAPKHPAVAVRATGAAAAALDHTRDRIGDRPAKRRGKAEEEPSSRRRALAEVRSAEVGLGGGGEGSEEGRDG